MRLKSNEELRWGWRSRSYGKEKEAMDILSLYAEEPRHSRKAGQALRMGNSWVKAHTEEF